MAEKKVKAGTSVKADIKKGEEKVEAKEAKEPKRDTSAIDAAIREIKTKFGDEAIMKLGDQARVDVDVIPSGSIGLDWALGIGGYPRGRIIEVFGPESSGKTTLALHAIASAQKAGGGAAVIVAAHALDPSYARKLGV